MAKPVTVTGQWRGLCLDENVETPQHDVVSINVDYSLGIKEPRKGFVEFDCTGTGALTTGVVYYPKIFTHDFGAGNQYMLIVGTSSLSGAGDVKVAILDFWGMWGFGTSALSVFNLSTLYGEPQFYGPPPCDSVGTMLTTSGGLTKTVTLITTKNQCFVFDPMEAPATRIRRMSATSVSSGGDAIKLADASFPYYATAPHGSIIEKHQQKYWWGGMRPADAWSLDSANPSTGTPASLTSVIQNATRDVQLMSPAIGAYSDEFDAAAVLGWHVFSPDGSEAITAYKAFQQDLIVWTPTSMYVLAGNDDSSFAFQVVSRGVGCVSNQSVVDVDGALYWAWQDGIYAWAGQGQPARISRNVDALWTGRYPVTHQSATFTPSTYGWPFKVRVGNLHWMRGSYRPQSRHIFWTLPTETYPGAQYGIMTPVLLVYAIDEKAWSIWFLPTQDDDELGYIVDIVTVMTAAGPLTWAINEGGRLYAYGNDDVDRTVATGVDGYNPPMFWLTGRILAASDVSTPVRRVHLKMLPLGKTPSSSPPKCIVRGERYYLDAAGETKATITCHQDDTAAQRFYDTATWDNFTWQAVDWFTSIVDVGLSDATPSVRVGVMDPFRSSTVAGPRVTVESFTVEYLETLGVRR